MNGLQNAAEKPAEQPLWARLIASAGHRLGRVGVELLAMGNDRLATLVTIALRELIASAAALEGKDADMVVALERARMEAERIGAEPVPS